MAFVDEGERRLRGVLKVDCAGGSMVDEECGLCTVGGGDAGAPDAGCLGVFDAGVGS